MRLFPVGEHPLSAVVHRPQHADAGMKQGTATFGGQDQGLYGSLPVGQFLSGPRQLQDVVGGVLQRDHAGDRVFEFGGPAQLSYRLPVDEVVGAGPFMDHRSARSANVAASTWLTFLRDSENRLAMTAREIDLKLGRFHRGSRTGKSAGA
jgi:hypothetical protein